MKRAFPLLIVGASALLTLACAQPAQQVATDSSQQESGQPKYGGMLRYAVSGIATDLHPYGGGSSGTGVVTEPIYELLLHQYQYLEDSDATPEGAIGPWLAESWTNPNPTTYIVKLRKDVTWQDGKRFTSADVIFSWDYLLENKGKFTQASLLSGVKSYRAIDDYTVEIVSKIPNADFLGTALAGKVKMLQKEWMKAGHDLGKEFMGTGAFKIKEFNTARGVIHVKNENYWYKGLPYIDGIIGYYNMDRSAMIAAMISGQLDIFKGESEPQFQTVKAQVPGLQGSGHSTGSNYSLRPKLTQPPFNDLRVRKAMHLAIDRQHMLDTLTGGKGTINSPAALGYMRGYAVPPEELLKMPGFNPATKQQDIAEAKRLLAEAGYPNGFKATLVYPGQNTGNPPLAEVGPTPHPNIGSDITLKPLENNTYKQVYNLKHDFELALDGAVGSSFGQNLLNGFHSQGKDNQQEVNDPALDKLIEKQAATVDVKERQKIFQEIQRIFLDNAYSIPLIEQLAYTVWQPWIHNVVTNRGQQVYPTYRPPAIWLDTSMFPAGRLQEEAKMIK